MSDSPDLALANSNVVEAMARGFIEIRGKKVKYNLNQKKEYDWSDPEEWVRARTIAFLIISKNYPANRIRTEVSVPRRTPSDWADVVVYRDDRCSEPFLVVENKSSNQTKKNRKQAIEQLFGNANSLRVPFGLYDENDEHYFFDIANFPPTERITNLKGGRNTLPELYGETPIYTYIAAGATDISPISGTALETKIRRSHSTIWSGGKRDPLLSFDEWSKILFAKVIDERNTPTGTARSFQIGTNETIASVANRVHRLFLRGCQDDTTIFQHGTRINLPDKKIYEVVGILQDISFMGTGVDSIGSAFENFFGSVFRGELGQYFTMRQIARFTVSILDISHEHYVIDPTAGSGGFLLEALLQVWNNIDRDYAGQPQDQIIRIKNDFALLRVFGIEIHEILSRICKINLLLHHDGHTNIEGDRSCLDSTFVKPRLQNWSNQFQRVIGNPPFGDEVSEADEDLLGSNLLENFTVAKGRSKVPSEHVILERAIDLLEPNGKLGLVLPDGLLNNQGEQSNCPQVRSFLARSGHIEAIVSLPDYAFRKSGAQNKTSILFFRKFTYQEKMAFEHIIEELGDVCDSTEHITHEDGSEETITHSFDFISYVYSMPPFNGLKVFLAEANMIGYSPAGALSEANELYNGAAGGCLDSAQNGTILGEWRRFNQDPESYNGSTAPDCLALLFKDMWGAHSSHRIDPKYHLFKRSEQAFTPDGWERCTIREVMRRRNDIIFPENTPNQKFLVLTIAQTGEIRAREAGKGHNPPEWRGMYFENSPSTWFRAQKGDVVFSSIDLWKGCIAVVTDEFDGCLVTKEFPIYEIIDERIDAEFLSYILRCRYYQRAFRAITTGHSNRRRTQIGDFEALEICFPPDIEEQRYIIRGIKAARSLQHEAQSSIKFEMIALSNIIDGRGEYTAFYEDGLDDTE